MKSATNIPPNDGLITWASSKETAPQIACSIFTSKKNHHLAIESYETWGKHCKWFFAFSEEIWHFSEDQTTIHTNEGQSREYYLWNEMHTIWDYLADLYEKEIINADYITFSGDDTFWIMHHLQQYLRVFPIDGRYFLGGTDSTVRKSRFPYIEGSGYVVSRRLIEERIVSKCPPFRVGAENIILSYCLYQFGVNFTDTRTKEGYSRFCRSKPSDPCFLTDGFNEITKPAKEVVFFGGTTGAIRKELHDGYYSSNKNQIME